MTKSAMVCKAIVRTAVVCIVIYAISKVFPQSASEENTAKNQKWGFVHINHLPFGHGNDWAVIDNETKLPISFKNGEKDKVINIKESDHVLISEYVVEWADDRQGIVGGFKAIRIYGKSYPESGFNIYSHTFSEKRNVSIVYKQK